MSNEYYGKYRAIVVDINDPQKRSRIRVQCPKVLGDATSSWCEICVPVAYDGGGDFCLPKVGETVWVEFEEGDVNKPIFVGAWWSDSKTLVQDYSKAKETRTIEFDGAMLEFTSEKSLRLTIGGSLIELTPEHILLSLGGSSIELTSSDITEIAGTIYLN